MAHRELGMVTALEAAIDAHLKHGSNETAQVVEAVTRHTAITQAAADILRYGGLTQRTTREVHALGLDDMLTKIA